MRDVLVPFVFDGAAVRGALVRLPTVARDVVAAHRYPPALARALGELTAASALLASTLKQDGSLLLQLSGEGPVRLAVVECTGDLAIRGTAQWDDARTGALRPEATLAELAGGASARMTITLDPKSGGALYQGIVALHAASIGALIEHYLATSEQLDSRLALSVRAGAAAGLLVQRLPGAAGGDDATWARAVATLASLPTGALHGAGSDVALLAGLFPDDDLRVFDARAVAARCSCSRERVINALRIAGQDEIEAALAERGAVEVTCEFCNRRYAFTPDEARAAVVR